MRNLFIPLIALVALSACTFQSRITGQAVSYNKAVENVNNELMLLNAVRASLGQPMTFTALTSVTNTDKVTAGLGFSLPFGGDATSVFTASPSASVQLQPSYEMTVLGSEQFIRGILKPIDMATLLLYFTQGWNPELVLLLTVEKIQDARGVYVNDPASKELFWAFQSKIREMLHRDARLIRDKKSPPEKEEIKPINARISGVSEGLGGNTKWVTRRVEDRKTYCAGGLGGYRSSGGGSGVAPPVYKIWAHDTKVAFQEAGATKQADGVIHLRSPQGTLFYLGELIGHPETKVQTCNAYGQADSDVFLIESVSADSPETGIVAVTYFGNKYFVPNTGAGRTMQALAFVAQIFGQQQNFKELFDKPNVLAIGN